MNILGISAFYHDSAASLVRDGEILAAAQEERFTRRKHDHRFPMNAVAYCLKEAGIPGGGRLDAVAFYDKPVLKFARILETYMGTAPRGLRTFMNAMPLWLKHKLWIPMTIESALESCGMTDRVPIYFPEHHESHAASAFFPSPYPSAAIMTLDGVGEWATTSLGQGVGNRMTIFSDLRFPHSLGLLYSAFTDFIGFKVNSGEYKLMGLAPYGEPKYVDRILDHLIDLKPDGSFRLNLEYFGFLDGFRMTNRKFAGLFGVPVREPESALTQCHIDLACSIQRVTEDVVMRMARHLHQGTGEKNLCMAGGVALNSVANGKLLRDGPFDNIWIQPAAGDAGASLGAALLVWHHVQEAPRVADGRHDRMKGALLGPEFTSDQIAAFLKDCGYPAVKLPDDEWASRIAALLADGHVVGLFRNRLEFGPRALGARSIIGDPRSPVMQSIMNRKIKGRESFRPFAPSCLESRVRDYFELHRASPYMSFVAPVHPEHRKPVPSVAGFRERINQVRSDIPAVTHVDFSARVQTVDPHTDPRYHALIEAFEKLTGYGMILNTSFNVRGEPIVCTPEDAYRCFMRTAIDDLVLGSFLLQKETSRDICNPPQGRAIRRLPGPGPGDAGRKV